MFNKVCIRTSVQDETASTIYRWAAEIVPPEDIILCAVLYFIEPSSAGRYEAFAQTYINNVIGNVTPGTLLFPSSSFPRYVTDMPNCHDEDGTFTASELQLESRLHQGFPNLPIEASDFASVHPIRYQARGGNWIPRIDIFDGEKFHYTRSRRDDGGYRIAATQLQSTLVKRLPNSWGKEQIELAIAGRVPGRSPSYWISVRINCWLTDRARRSI